MVAALPKSAKVVASVDENKGWTDALALEEFNAA